MAAPKCKICGKSHYGMCNPKDLPDLTEAEKNTQSTTWRESVSESAPVEKQPARVERPPQDRPTSNDGPTYDRNAPARVKRWREKNREKYNADQRERMREYRRRNK